MTAAILINYTWLEGARPQRVIESAKSQWRQELLASVFCLRESSDFPVFVGTSSLIRHR